MSSFAAFRREDVERSIPEVFAECSRRHANRLAFKLGEEQLSYDTLNRHANRIAHAILGHGLQHQQNVAVLLPKSARAIAAMLGVLKAGMVHVPLDTVLPQTRVDYILEDTAAPLLITCSECLNGRGIARQRVDVINLDNIGTGLSEDDPEVRIAPDALSFLLYTSGSTGRPKGVMQTHRNMLHAVMGHVNILHIGRGDRLMCPSSFGFLGAIRAILAPLLAGAAFFPVRLEDLPHLTEILRQERITHWHAPCSFLRHYLNTLSEPPLLPDLLRFYGGGEPLYRNDVLRWRELFGPRPIFVYVLALTETDIIRRLVIDGETVLNDEVVPLGYPTSDVELLILDQESKPVRYGQVGEIAARSRYLSPGYWNLPELTARRFLPDSEDPTQRLYLTGDLGRLRPDGCLEYHGRADFQVKIRGHLVQAAEVEAALRRLPNLKDALVMPRAEANGQNRLVAYCVPMQENSPPTVSSVRAELQTRLPEYMIPAAFVFLSHIPLTANGKVNRAALPEPESVRPDLGVAFEGPQTGTQETIASLWSEVLRVSPVGIHDNFFELGGDSLLATQVVIRLCDTFKTEVPLSAIFGAPTVSALALHVEHAAPAETQTHTPPVTPVRTATQIPLSFPQQMLWRLHKVVPRLVAYNVPVAMRLIGKLNVAALERSLREIIRRHEAVRTTFRTVRGVPVQVVAPSGALKFDNVDLTNLPESSRHKQAHLRLIQEARRRLSLRRGPLVRAILLKLDDQDHLFLLTVHHIVFDGWSVDVLYRELALLYEAFSTWRPSPLKELPIQYGDFCHWQRRWHSAEQLPEHMAYWQKHLAGMPRALELPSDRPRGLLRTFRGARQTVLLPMEVWTALDTFSRARNATLFMTLLSAYQVLLARLTGQFDQVVGSPIAGRHRVELEPLIGFFMNMLILRNDLSGNPSFTEILSRVRNNTLAAYEHQELPFQELYARLRPPFTTRHMPLIQSVFILQNTPGRSLRLPGLVAQPVQVDNRTAKFDLSCIIHQDPSGPRITFEYSKDLFDPATVSRLMGDYVRLLGQLPHQPDVRLSQLPISAD